MKKNLTNQLPSELFTTKFECDDSEYTLKELCEKRNVDFDKTLEYIAENNMCDGEIDFTSIAMTCIPGYYMNVFGQLVYFGF